MKKAVYGNTTVLRGAQNRYTFLCKRKLAAVF